MPGIEAGAEYDYRKFRSKAVRLGTKNYEFFSALIELAAQHPIQG